MWTREEEMFQNLSPEKQASIEIVSSAYASVFAEKAYLTMPVTTGKRFYDVLDHYNVKSVEELEQKRPGALREEIIIPNIEEGKALAAKIRHDNQIDALVVPGIFEARKQRWTQEEYMVLWLRFINSSAQEVYLSDGWEYSNGGAIEFVRALALRNGFVHRDTKPAWPPKWIPDIYDHNGNGIELEKGIHKLMEAIADLNRRGYDTTTLRHEASLVETFMWKMSEWDITHSIGFEMRWSDMSVKVSETMRAIGVEENPTLVGL